MATNSSSSSSSSSSSANKSGGDGIRPLPMEQAMQFIDFKLECVKPNLLEGRFVVSELICQPFPVLHPGICAMIAESLASSGAHIACGFQRVAGIELNINHLRAAPVGTEV
eukprot:c23743_g1_i1 orf=46-378(+)